MKVISMFEVSVFLSHKELGILDDKIGENLNKSLGNLILEDKEDFDKKETSTRKETERRLERKMCFACHRVSLRFRMKKKEKKRDREN